MQHGECNFKKIHFKSIYKPRGFHMWGMVLKYIRASPTGILNRAPILLFWCHSKNNNNSIGPQLKSLLYGGPQIFPLSPILKGCVRSSLLPGEKKSLHQLPPTCLFSFWLSRTLFPSTTRYWDQACPSPLRLSSQQVPRPWRGTGGEYERKIFYKKTSTGKIKKTINVTDK